MSGKTQGAGPSGVGAKRGAAAEVVDAGGSKKQKVAHTQGKGVLSELARVDMRSMSCLQDVLAKVRLLAQAIKESKDETK
jgi:hypothetical protein